MLSSDLVYSKLKLKESNYFLTKTNPVGHFTTNALIVCLVVLPATVFAQMKVFLITPPGLINIRVGVGVGVAVTVTVTVGAGDALTAAADACASTYIWLVALTTFA